MNIYAIRGTIVIFAHANAGYGNEGKVAKKYLRLGKIYTVDYTDGSRWSTDVYLLEVPGMPFNSVLFNDAPQQKQRHRRGGGKS